MRTVLLLLAAIQCCVCAGWQAGSAVVDITPTEPIWLAGYVSRTKPSESVRQPIHAKALALKYDSGATSVIVTIDVVGIRREMTELIAQRAATELHIPRERILFNVSHTHSAPVVHDAIMYERSMGPYAKAQMLAVARYDEMLPQRLYSAISGAVGNLKPASLYFGQGFAGFAVNRRRVTHREYPGLVDPDVPVLAVRGQDGGVVAVVFGYACHNTVMDDYTVHGDYAGYAQSYLQQKFPGAVALFIMGAGADANPLPRRNAVLLERYGGALADAVEDVVRGAMTRVDGPLDAVIAFPELKFEGPFTRDRWIAETKSSEPLESEHGRIMLRLMDAGQDIPQSRLYTVQIWQFGRAMTLIALAGELTVDYALKFKSRYGWDTTWVAGYSNDVFGYVPSVRVWKEGGYEGGESFRFTTFPGRLTADVEDRITAAVEQGVAQLRRVSQGQP